MLSAAGIRIRLVLVTNLVPPIVHDGAETQFGVQDKHRALHTGVQQADGSKRFEIEVMAKQAEDGQVTFSGQFVHGTPTERFLYLGWRPNNGPVDGWIRRWKIPLSDLAGRVNDANNPGDRFEGAIDRNGAGQVWLRNIEWKRVKAGGPPEQPEIGYEEN
jgi:hypothetical protein